MSQTAKKSETAAKTTAKAPSKTPAKAAAAKPAAAKSPKGETAFSKAMKPSADLAAVIGPDPVPRTAVVSKLWEYIKKHDLQDPANKRNIKPDAHLKKVFDGRDQVTMFEMNKFIGKHLS